jgi:alpha-mannosidase
MIFTLEKLDKQLRDVRAAIHRGVRPITAFKTHDGDCPGAEAVDFDDRDWADFSVGSTWGGYDKVAWFRARVPVPPAWRERKLALRFLVGPRDGGGSTAETMLYLNGAPLQAIDVWHEEAWLPPEALRRDELSVALRAWSGVLAVPERRHFKLAQLIWIDEAAERLTYLGDTVLKAARVLAENDLRRVQLVQALNEAARRIDFSQPRSEAFYRSLDAAAGWLAGCLAEWAERDELKPTVVAVGHAHIDMAWLWRLAHSREKAARTFATALHLMRQYPEYRFSHSSPQLYKFLKQDDPELFARVKERIAAGEWEITGGMWVESDTNLPAGESLVRQFLLGRRFLREEFGLENTLLWSPDVFGYSYALPQIIRKSGLKYFITSKISWNQTNRFPYDTFRWRGLDGSEVLAYFITTPHESAPYYTYNGQLRPFEVQGSWSHYRQKELNAELLMPFGWGDGGGGPTKEMLECGRALRNLPGLPRVAFGTAEPFMARLEQRLAGQALPVWDGELYLEYHRGTYTSQAAGKRANRKSEVLYHAAEWLSAVAAVAGVQSRYPADELRAGWELLLLNQFHDILPGSSIRPVYEDSLADYARLAAIGQQAVDEARASLLAALPAEGPALAVFNPLGWARSALLELPAAALGGGSLVNPDGRPSPVQPVEVDGEPRVLVEAAGIPPLGYGVYPLAPAAPATPDDGELRITPTHLQNRFYAIELNERGQLVRLTDRRHGREVLAPGARGNVLQVFEDRPLAFDAWDIDLHYQEKMSEVDELVEAVVEESGPLRGTLRLIWRYHDSLITQRLSLYAGSPRIDFRTEVDWRQAQILLKAAFAVAVRATRATYDIQFGAIERPTHWNTSWDWARFEVCGHKWADLSEGDYGVSLLNDCKYGHDVKDNVLRLTLLRSPIDPDAAADKGRHVFTYSLWPHAGDWRAGGVVPAGYELNFPVLSGPIPAAQPGGLPARYAFATAPGGEVIVETVKQAEDGDGWVVRVYEWRQSRHAAVALEFGQPIADAVECNLMEEDPQPAAAGGRTLTFAIAPYEIKTFKIRFSP